MNQPELGQKISELRKKQGMTQEELADKCTINTLSIQWIEAGEFSPRAYTRRILAAALGIEDKILIDNSNRHRVNSSRDFSKDLIMFRQYGRNQLKVAWIAGLIWLAFMIPQGIMDFISNGPSELSVAFKFWHFFISFISLVMAVLFLRGFVILGRESENSTLLVSSYIFITATVIMNLFFILPIEYPENPHKIFDIVMLIVSMIFAGSLLIFFGIGILQMKAQYGRLAKYAGIFSIIQGSAFAAVIFFFVGVVLVVPGTILQIMLLYRACSQRMQPSLSYRFL
ncbi:MAG: helix-turn-helix transcriptional regulator [Desulfobacteraceae bacterium]|jgi:transcriptional regulator with XRE-family HTH domain